jgi:chromosome segregation ATPase
MVADLNAAQADLATANSQIAELEASLEAAQAAQAEFDTQVEAKAAEIAARAGTDPAAITGSADGSADQSQFASMTDAQKWAHCSTITNADEKRAFYLKHLSGG